MFVGSYTPFVAGFAKLFSIPKKWTDESNMAQTWIHHNYALFFSSNPMVRWELELRSKGSYSYSELQMGEPKKELRIVRYSQAPDGFSQTRMFDKCGSTQLLGGLGFTWSFFPTPKAPCPPGCLEEPKSAVLCAWIPNGRNRGILDGDFAVIQLVMENDPFLACTSTKLPWLP